MLVMNSIQERMENERTMWATRNGMLEGKFQEECQKMRNDFTAELDKIRFKETPGWWTKSEASYTGYDEVQGLEREVNNNQKKTGEDEQELKEWKERKLDVLMRGGKTGWSSLKREIPKPDYAAASLEISWI